MYLGYVMRMTQPNRRMFWHLSRAHRRVSAAADENLADIGLTGTQAGALFCFTDDGLLVGELAAALDLAQSAASGLAQRLEDAGLIARHEVEGDGRAARLKLTAVGRRKRDEAVRRTVAANARLLQGFSDKDIEIVVRWLSHAADTAAPKPVAAKRMRRKEKA
ncbi:MAG: MarR family winged helix-turn-helix transcriptional regulator [Hyphomonadaceae bacterium]